MFGHKTKKSRLFHKNKIEIKKEHKKISLVLSSCEEINVQL